MEEPTIWRWITYITGVLLSLRFLLEYYKVTTKRLKLTREERKLFNKKIKLMRSIDNCKCKEGAAGCNKAIM